MKYKIIVQRSAEKFLRKQNKKTQERLLGAIYKLPYGTGIKKSRGDIYKNL